MPIAAEIGTESTGENQRKPLESSISNPALVVSEVL